MLKLINTILALLVKYVIWPVVLYTAKVATKVALFALIQLLKATLATVVFAFNLIVIDSLKLALRSV